MNPWRQSDGSCPRTNMRGSRLWGAVVWLMTATGMLFAVDSPDGTETESVDEKATEPARVMESPRLRDPFWPVGYEPPPEPVAGEEQVYEQEEPEPEVPDIEPPDWEAAGEQLNFQGTFRARGRDLASVNGQIVEVGDVIGVRRAPWIYHWRVTAIERTGITTTPKEAIPVE